MSRLVDRRPAAAPPVVLLLHVLGTALLATTAGNHLAPRRLLGWVAAAGALLPGVRLFETAFQRGLVHPPG
jgi:hypothetical protein